MHCESAAVHSHGPQAEKNRRKRLRSKRDDIYSMVLLSRSYFDSPTRPSHSATLRRTPPSSSLPRLLLVSSSSLPRPLHTPPLPDEAVRTKPFTRSPHSLVHSFTPFTLRTLLSPPLHPSLRPRRPHPHPRITLSHSTASSPVSIESRSSAPHCPS